jgi:hypothetical protein
MLICIKRYCLFLQMQPCEKKLTNWPTDRFWVSVFAYLCIIQLGWSLAFPHEAIFISSLGKNFFLTWALKFVLLKLGIETANYLNKYTRFFIICLATAYLCKIKLFVMPFSKIPHFLSVKIENRQFKKMHDFNRCTTLINVKYRATSWQTAFHDYNFNIGLGMKSQTSTLTQNLTNN